MNGGDTRSRPIEAEPKSGVENEGEGEKGRARPDVGH